MLFSEQGRKAIVDATFILEDPVPGPLGEAARALAELQAPKLEEAEKDFALIFGHTLRGRVCPYETEYGVDAVFRQAQELADITAYYGAFGLEPTRADRVDHVGFELDFLEFLGMKEVYAAESHDAEMREVTEGALRGFLRDHLGRFGVSFGTELEREAPDRYYSLIGRLCAAFLTAECRRRGIDPGPELLPLASAEPDDVPMACGRESDLVHIET